ncbi:hypothetical protein P3T16_005525 [Paraburkholderia sp. GAS42]
MQQTTRVLHLRLKDRHTRVLQEQARAINFLWNHCNGLSTKVWERERRFLSGYDFYPFTKGAGTAGSDSIGVPCTAFFVAGRSPRRPAILYANSQLLGRLRVCLFEMTDGLTPSPPSAYDRRARRGKDGDSYCQTATSRRKNVL